MTWTTATIRVPDQPFLDTSEVVALVKVHPKTIQRWVREGRFPPPRRKGLWSGLSVGVWLAFQEYTAGVEMEDEGEEIDPGEKPVKNKKVES